MPMFGNILTSEETHYRVEGITDLAGRSYCPARGKLRIVEGEEVVAPVAPRKPTNDAGRLHFRSNTARRSRTKPLFPVATTHE